MKLYAQIGHGPNNKVNKGLAESIIDGAIFSPKNIKPSTIKKRISDIRKRHNDADIFIDPQFYATFLANSKNSNIGKIDEWDYFRAYRKSQLEQESVVKKVLNSFFHDIMQFPVTGIISPNPVWHSGQAIVLPRQPT